MAPMALSDSKLVKLDDTGFKAATYKRGLSILEGQILKYKEHEVPFSKEIALLKRSVGLEEFKEPENKDWKEKFFCPANHVREEEPKKARENNDAPIIEDWVSDDEDDDEPNPKVEKKTVIPTATKKEFVKPEKPVRRSVSCPKTSHPSAHKHMAPKAVLMKTGLKSVNTARPVNTVRSVNTGKQGVSESSTSSQQDQDCIIMPIWKDASYFGDDAPRSVADAQIQDKDRLQDENDATEKSHEDSSLKDNGTADQQVNTASPEVNTGSSEVNIATPEDLVGPSPASEDTQVEDQEIELGNIPPSYAVPTTPHIRIHKDHPIDHVIGDLQIEAIRIFLDYASYMGFMVYQMDVKSSFLYGQIEEEVYVYQPPGFEDPDHPDKVYKVVKALYGLHQAPRAWYDTLANYLLCNGFQRGNIDQTLFIKRQKGHILLVHIYVDDIIFRSTKKELCDEFEKLMKDKFQMSSMGELTFFLGLQVQQEKKGIFISQDKYVHEILRKYNYIDVKSASTPTDLEKPLVQDGDAADVDEHLYRSMIGSLMYLTASRPDIMFAVCACARFQVSPKTSHLLAVKRIFRYLKGKPSLGLWYPKDSPLELVAYTDSDYAGATQDRKSTTRGCQFLGNRLISWQCKKQTVVATSTTEAEYVAAANCCGQVLWIQNQLLDYGYNFMNTIIYIDNTSTICIIENPVQHSKTKHIEIRHHFIRDCNAKKLIQMAKIDTKHNVADLLTKGFDAEQTATALASPKQTAIGKDYSNLLMAGSLPKTILCVKLSAEATNDDNGQVQITATIDGHSMTISKASLRRHLKLNDHDGNTFIPNSEIFEQLSLMGYHTDSNKLTFQKGAFSPQWRFIQICLDMQRKQLQQHSRTYLVPSLNIKVFNNMKRPTKGYSGKEVALFPTMLDVSEPSTSPSRITSSPSHSPSPSPSAKPSIEHSPEPSFEHSPDHTTAVATQPSPTQPSATQTSPTQPSPT
ncbi:putative ribonuclease H-like domain-containing protein [Tanacetum coccineum]